MSDNQGRHAAVEEPHVTESQTDTQPNEAKRLLEMRPEEKQPYWTPARRKNLREWVVSLLVAVVAVVIVRMFLFTVIRVDGPSMQETLINGDRLIVTILDMKLSGPHRGDVVICHFPGDEPQGNFAQKAWGSIMRDRYVKRVIGLPGETLEIRSNVTYINGEALEENYVVHPPRGDYGPTTIPEGHYLVMGDNRGNSHDGRYGDVGPLPREAMLGKVRLIMWPIGHAGIVD